jgi:release factor glutamine methyltransferase
VSEPPWTVLRVLNWTTSHFGEHGLPTPRLDAEVLLAHVLRCDRVALYVRFDQPLVRAELDAYKELVRRRLRGEPVAYLRGTKEFWSLPLAVDQRVLIPRPETELLVEAILALTAAAPAGVIADIGTGSGAIALAFKKERPGWRVLATDISAGALAVARANATHLRLDIELLEGDLLAPVRAHGPLDVIVSNPPYLAEDELARTMTDVREHEPRLALIAGPDALTIVRRLADESYSLLRPGGALALEIATASGTAVRALLEARGFAAVVVQRDYAGHDRVAVGRVPG